MKPCGGLWLVLAFYRNFAKKQNIQNSYRGVYAKGVKPTTTHHTNVENENPLNVCPSHCGTEEAKRKN